jgi:hypothetical protein
MTLSVTGAPRKTDCYDFADDKRSAGLVSVRSTVGTRGHYRKLPRCPGAETGSRKGVATAARASHPTLKGLVLTQRSVRQNKADVVALARDKGLGKSRRRPNIHCTGAWPSGRFLFERHTAPPGERVVR